MDLADVLADNSFTVIEAANTDEAFRALKSRSGVQALPNDIDMPGSMDGIALAKLTAIRWLSCKIDVISGRYKLEEGSLPIGARFLSKPVSEDQLADTLRTRCNTMISIDKNDRADARR